MEKHSFSFYRCDMSLVREDTPSRAFLRAQLMEECLDEFVKADGKFGNWNDSSKTAKSIRTEGAKKGRQGVFSRLFYSRFLHIEADFYADPVIQRTPLADPAVENELLQAGRSPDNVREIMGSFQMSLEKAAETLDEFVDDASNDLVTVEPYGQDKVVLRLKSEENNNDKNATNYPFANYTISNTHLEKLKRLYAIHSSTTVEPGDNEPYALFCRRVFCVLARYELFAGGAGYQMAFTDEGFKWLRENLKVDTECFASPLNCWNDNFCSLAVDTDRFFGSKGNFFKLIIPPIGGAYEANPPFVEAVIDKCAESILHNLKNTVGPLTFVVIVPDWTNCAGIKAMRDSEYLRPTGKPVMVVDKHQHSYRPGMQHREDHAHQSSNVNTLIFFLRNKQAEETETQLTEAKTEELKQLLKEETLAAKTKNTMGTNRQGQKRNGPISGVDQENKRRKTDDRDRPRNDDSVESMIAIIVPFRELNEGGPRFQQLNQFIARMTDLLDRTERKYHFYIVEQMKDTRRFNRGKLLNAGYVIAKQDKCDTFIFHDVDLIPDPGLMQLYKKPREFEMFPLGKRFMRYNEGKPETEKFYGGVNVFEQKGFELINGFPNNYWGWGGEDNAIGIRIDANKSKMIETRVPPTVVGVYEDLEKKTIKAKRGEFTKNVKIFGKIEVPVEECNNRYELKKAERSTWATNGLKTLNFTVKKVDNYTANCTRLLVDLETNGDPTDGFAFYGTNQRDYGKECMLPLSNSNTDQAATTLR